MRAYLLCAAVLLAACGSEPDPGTVASTTTAGSSTGSASSTGASSTGSSSTGTNGSSGSTGSGCVDTWAGYAQGFFDQHCARCHGTWSYSDVQGSASAIQSAIDSGAMPRDETLSASDKARIDAWFSCGLPP